MTEIVELLKPNSVVGVRFPGTSTTVYDYTSVFLPENASELKHAVVLIGNSYKYNMNDLRVVEIVRVRAYDPVGDKELKPVAVLFNADNCAQFLVRRQRREELEQELRNRVSRRSLEMNFEAILKDDAVGLKLLEEFKSLG